MRQESNFTTGKITKPLILFALPLILSQVLQALYGGVDLMIVGKFADTASVSAVGNGSQLMYCLTTIILGITTGNTILIANGVGRGDEDGVSRVILATIKVLSVATLVIIVLTVALAEQITKLLHTPPEAFQYAVDYIRICGGGLIFVAGYNMIASIYRGVGNSVAPLIFVAVACVINIIGDLIFVAWLHMAATGAAIATVIAQASSVLFSVVYFFRSKLPYKYSWQKLWRTRQVKNVLKVGAPIALQDFLTSISFIIITSIVNTLGVHQSAAVGIVEKLFVFLSIIPMSFMSALSAFVAQNVGGDNIKRANKAHYIATGICFGFSVVLFLLAFFGANALCSIFEKDPVVIAEAARYLQGTSAEYLIMGILYCLLGYLNGRGKTAFVMIQGLLTAFFVRVPLSYVFTHESTPNMFRIGLAVAISSVVAVALTLVMYGVVRVLDGKREKKAMLNKVEE